MPASKYICVCVLLVLCATANAQNTSDPNLLWEQATLYRDEWGVPHIYADNPRALGFAFGFAQAEDHIEGMLRAYRVARGSAAEVAGPRLANSDAFSLLMGHWDLARRAYENLDPVTRDVCEGFALGANTWLMNNSERAPVWAEGISPVDVLALMHCYLTSHAPFDLPDTYHRVAGTPSANAWAVSASNSVSGEALLVINPHTNYNDVFQWYEAHLSMPGLNMIGATLYGLPLLLQGHNDTLGWALAPNKPDFADVYIEPELRRPRPNPKSVGRPAIDVELAQYLLSMGDIKRFFVRTDQGYDQRVIKRQFSSRGPIIARKDGRTFSYRVGGYGEFGALTQLLAMGKAQSLAQFQTALARHQLPLFHVVYADKEGNIFYLYNAKVGNKYDIDVPVVRASSSPRGLVWGDPDTTGRGIPASSTRGPGTLVWDAPLSTLNSAFAWGPVIPAQALPSLLNPEAGYVQACATPPWLVTDNTGTSPDDWPVWFARDSDSYRAKRARQLLSLGKRSFEDMQAMVYDLVVPVAIDAVPYLLSLAEQHPGFIANAHPDLVVGLDLLRDWNRVADPRSSAMTFFHVWWSVFQTYDPSKVMTPDELYFLLRQNSPGIQRHALQSASDAAKLLRNTFQSLDVPWGEVHQLQRGNRSVQLGGSISGEPLFLTEDIQFVNRGWPVTGGYGYAMAVRFGDKTESVSIVPFGTSDDPNSPHYDDQLDLFADKKMKVTHFRRDDVERYAQSGEGKIIALRPDKSASRVIIRAAGPIRASLVTTENLDAPLPVGTVAYSAYMEPRYQPATMPVSIDFEMHIPESVAAFGDLGQLALFAYQPQSGWVRLEEQRLEPARRTLVARAHAPRVFAVLGPEGLVPTQLASRNVERSAVAQPEDTAPATRVLVPRQTTPAAGTLQPSEERAPVEAPQDERVAARRNFNTRTQRSKATPSPEKVNVEQPPSAATPVAPEAPSASTPAPQTVARETATAPIRDHGLPFAPQSTAGIVDVREGAKGLVIWSMRPPSAFIETPEVLEHERLIQLVPDSVPASPMRIGSDLQLRPPVPGALFHLKTDKTVRARVTAETQPPAALPTGLAQFTPVFSVVYAPAYARGSVAITIRLLAGVCAPEHFDSLHLYSYDQDEGWQQLKGQRAKPETQSFSALDLKLRAYTVLGPAEFFAAGQNP